MNNRDLAFIAIICFTILLGIAMVNNHDKPQKDISGSTNVPCDRAYLFDNTYDLENTSEGGCKYKVAR